MTLAAAGGVAVFENQQKNTSNEILTTK